MATKKKDDQAAAAPAPSELAQLLAQMQAHTELLGVIACATVRTMQIVEAEASLKYGDRKPKAFDDALGLAARAQSAMRKLAEPQA